MAVPSFSSFSGVPKFSSAVSINPAEVTGDSVSVQTFTVPGLTVDMIPVVGWPGTAEFADVRIISARITAANTLELALFGFGSTRNLAAFTIQVVGL